MNYNCFLPLLWIRHAFFAWTLSRSKSFPFREISCQICHLRRTAIQKHGAGLVQARATRYDAALLSSLLSILVTVFFAFRLTFIHSFQNMAARSAASQAWACLLLLALQCLHIHAQVFNCQGGLLSIIAHPDDDLLLYVYLQKQATTLMLYLQSIT